MDRPNKFQVCGSNTFRFRLRNVIYQYQFIDKWGPNTSSVRQIERFSFVSKFRNCIGFALLRFVIG